MTNEVITKIPICANSMVDKSRFLKRKPNKNSVLNKINAKLFIY